MLSFTFWYAYYDCIFLKRNPNPIAMFMPTREEIKEEWPGSAKIMALVECFKELQAFILDHKNWGESICTIQQLNKIESEVNQVLILLSFQKIYIEEFWGQHYRRIEASLTHFYSILQIFIRSIIPYDTMTLFECKAANKLCIRIGNLQNLIKFFMSKINRICQFFSQQFYSQEHKIIQNFFQNFVAYIKKIPQIKKIQMFHIPQLLRYITIVNPIEISEMAFHKAGKTQASNQMKHCAIKQIKAKRASSLEGKKKNGIILHDVFIYFKRKYRNSCPRLSATREGERVENLIRTCCQFQFPVWIRRHSIAHRKETLGKISKQLSFNYPKGKSNTQIRLQSPQKLFNKVKNKTIKLRYEENPRQNSFFQGPHQSSEQSPTKLSLRKRRTTQLMFKEHNTEEDLFEVEAVVQKVKYRNPNEPRTSQKILNVQSFEIIESKWSKVRRAFQEQKLLQSIKSIMAAQL